MLRCFVYKGTPSAEPVQSCDAVSVHLLRVDQQQVQKIQVVNENEPQAADCEDALQDFAS